MGRKVREVEVGRERAWMKCEEDNRGSKKRSGGGRSRGKKGKG